MQHHHSKHPEIRDYGPKPFVFNVRHAAERNTNFRTALWTGQHLQLTVMCVPAGCDIGVEMHGDVDQFLCVQEGRAKVLTGHCQHTLCNEMTAGENDAILIPAGTWHNIVNATDCPLKLYSLYAPPNHPHGTVNVTKADAHH